MKKYGSIDLLKKLYSKLCATDIIYDDIDNEYKIVDFKISIDLVGHVNVTYQKHYVIVSPIEYTGSTDYIIDDLSDNEHYEYCDTLNDICTCVSNIIKSWFE